MRVAAVCMNSKDDKPTNIQKACHLIEAAGRQGASWVVLPELFPYMGGYTNQYDIAEYVGSPLLQQLANLAQQLQITIFAGSVAERAEQDSEAAPLTDAATGIRKVYNTALVFAPDGQIKATYRKCHLFALADDQGGQLIAEDSGFYRGNKIVSFDHEGFRVGLAICYDIRFAEFFAQMTRQMPLDVLVVSAAFTKQTGKDHWHLLLRARAVELQCYVVASNQYGIHGDAKESFGHSLIIDPWGEIVADSGDQEAVIVTDLAKTKIAAVRSKLSVLQHKRPELY